MIVQLAFAPTLPPLSITLVAPGAAAIVPPPHVVVAPGDAATEIPIGRLSVSDIPLSATEPVAVFGIVMVRTELLPAVIDVGEKALLIATGGATSRSAVAGAVLDAPCVDVTAFAGIVFVYVPGVEAVTDTVMVQFKPAARPPPVSATLDPPLVAVAVPEPQVVAAFGVAATTTPVGNVSVNARPESAVAPVAVFLTVTVKVEVPFGAMLVGEKALVTVTAGAAVKVTVPLAGF